MNINGISSVQGIKNTATEAGKKTGDDSFKNILDDFLSEANETDYSDKLSNTELMIGNADNTHQPMIAAEKADISLRLTVQIRNKVLDAYNEIMRMQI